MPFQMHLTIHDPCTSPSDAALPAERRTLLTEAETFKLTASPFTCGGAQRMAQRAALAAEGARSGVFRALFGVSWFAPSYGRERGRCRASTRRSWRAPRSRCQSAS